MLYSCLFGSDASGLHDHSPRFILRWLASLVQHSHNLQTLLALECRRRCGAGAKSGGTHRCGGPIAGLLDSGVGNCETNVQSNAHLRLCYA